MSDVVWVGCFISKEMSQLVFCFPNGPTEHCSSIRCAKNVESRTSNINILPFPSNHERQIPPYSQNRHGPILETQG